MKTIEQNTKNEIIIHKSRFITFLIKTDSVSQALTYLKEIRKEHKDATHCCFGYIIGQAKKASDDGEPSGTAGVPILNVLENNELTNILCVVVRYFGGIKLGAGGLIRAYTKSVTSCLKISQLKTIELGYKITISFTYEQTKIIHSLIKNYDIISKQFDDTITYQFLINQDDSILDNLHTICEIKQIKKVLL